MYRSKTVKLPSDACQILLLLMIWQPAGSAISANVKYLMSSILSLPSLQVFVVMELMIKNIKNVDDMKWGPSFAKTKNDLYN